jgi:hypothetical protein
LLRAASRRAGGQLRVLDVSGWRKHYFYALLAVAEENGASLTEIRAWSGARLCDDYANVTLTRFDTHFNHDDVLRLVQAAPQLSRLECDLHLDSDEAATVLAGDEPFPAVHAQNVLLYVAAAGDFDPPPVVEVLP